jgi:hypothetical protein
MQYFYSQVFINLIFVNLLLGTVTLSIRSATKWENEVNEQLTRY